MRDIEVFYHVYIPADDTSKMWTWWVDEQLGLMKSSKLADIATINVAITMPKHWLADINHPVEFWVLVVDYIKTRYPFVNILNIRDVFELNIFEGQTLRFLHEACKDRDIDVLYVHTKGFRSMTPSVANWRQILNHYNINQWHKCLKHLELVDLVGIKDDETLDTAVSGNFWWSKSEYIRTLAEPLDSTAYEVHPDYHPQGPSYRYAFESWITSKQPKVFHTVDTRTNHYKKFCFLEQLVKQ